MGFSLFFNFDGTCKEAAEFYARVFESEVEALMTFDQMPPDPSYVVADEDKGKIMYCNVPIYGFNLMLSDVPSDMELVVGNNISPVVSRPSADEVRRLFDALGDGGEVAMELQETFWSGLYGMVTDKFGIGWQVMIDEV